MGRVKLTNEEKQNRKDFAEISKQVDHEAGRNRIKRENGFRSFIIFDGTKVSEGGWHNGKWMTARFMNNILKKWVAQSYFTRADNLLKRHNAFPLITNINFKKLQQIDDAYDLTAGCAQCGGCDWFAAFDADYGLCFNPESPNEGRVTFEHGGCIQHSFIQELLKKDTI
jgi:hypothetical protein